MPVDVVVVGSINHDLTLFSGRHPRPGETILGAGHLSGPGGKGANQAVAARRLGSSVAMVAMVGDDDTGRAMVANLQSEGIDTAAVGVDESAPTGLAVITVDSDAQNAIVVSPGANLALSPHHLDAALLSQAKVVLSQLEIPIDTVIAAARLTRGLFCLNPAPAQPLSPELLSQVDVLVPNRSELGSLAGAPEPVGLDEVVDAVTRIEGPAAIIVTLGSDGALVFAGGTPTPIAAPMVKAVDTTGAGDAFCGALAAALAEGSPLIDAARRAVVVGAIATTRRGAQPAMPTIGEVEALLDR